jgi:hypothetical protein
MKKYHLAASDLESIFPIEENRNPRGGNSLVQKFNECDVRELSGRLKSVPSSFSARVGSSSPSKPLVQSYDLAVPKGPKILRTKAAKEFGVSTYVMSQAQQKLTRLLVAEIRAIRSHQTYFYRAKSSR